MPAPSRASSHSIERARGAALLMAMLTMALVAGVAGMLLADFGHSLDSVAGRHDQAQARLLARAAVDWARNVLAEDERTTSVDHAREPWNVKVPPTPVEEGEVSGEIRDQSGLFNLNSLAPSGKRDPVAIASFARLLVQLGVAGSNATALAEGLSDWLDVDRVAWSGSGPENVPDGPDGTPAYPANGPLVQVDELARVPGFDAALRERLRPFVAALPAPSQVNVNIAPAEVLVAMLPRLRIDQAQVLAAERDRAWFKDLADFSARLPDGVSLDDSTRYAVTSRFFLATGRARFGVAVARMEILLDRKQRWSDILWQRIL